MIYDPNDSKFAADLSPLIADYEGYLVDPFGVIHDGQALLPGAAAALARLRAAGKPVVILSNSGKRAAVNERRLSALGLPRCSYLAVMTSGEVAWQGLHTRRDPPFRDLGRSCLFFSRGADHSAVAGLDIEVVEEPGSASFVYLSGLDPSQEAAERCRRLLQKARRLGLPLLCSNPDLTVVDGPALGHGPGHFAKEYAQSGGEVHWVGKPCKPIYRAALDRLGLPAHKVLAIGDSLKHDIAGAAAMGLASALVASGLHRAAFAGAKTEAEILHRLSALARACPGQATPGWLLPTFSFERANM